MPSPSAEHRLLRGLVELQDAAGLGDPVDPATAPPTPPRPAERRPSTAHLARRGPFAALLLPGLLGMVALGLLAGGNDAARGVAGFAAAVLAAPLLPVLGVPLRSGSTPVTVAIVGSIVVWLGLGGWAERRAARSSSPSWSRFAAEYLWMVLAVWFGLVLAAVASNLVLGRPLV